MKIKILSMLLIPVSAIGTPASAGNIRCVVTKSSGQVALYHPPALSFIQLDPENLPVDHWGFDDNGGPSAYFNLPGPLVAGPSKILNGTKHTSYSAENVTSKFAIDVFLPKNAFPDPNLPIAIWIEATTEMYGRGHLLIECLN